MWAIKDVNIYFFISPVVCFSLRGIENENCLAVAKPFDIARLSTQLVIG